MPVTRPRVRAADGSGELHLPAYDLFTATEILGRMALEKMLAGLSSRRYACGLEPAGQRGRGRGDRDEQVGGVAPVRGRDRDRARGADEPPPVRAGPGRVHGRRGALRRAHLRRGAGHRHRRGQAPARGGGGLDRERRRRHRPDHRAARPRPGHQQARPGRPRRRQGPVQGGQGRLRQAGHRQVSAAQDPERDRQAARTAQARSPRSGCGWPTTPSRRSRPKAELQALARELDKTHPGAAASRCARAWPRP